MLPLVTNFKFNFSLRKKNRNSFSMDTYVLFKQNYEVSNTYEQINNHIGINLTLLLYDVFFSEQILSK